MMAGTVQSWMLNGTWKIQNLKIQSWDFEVNFNKTRSPSIGQLNSCFAGSSIIAAFSESTEANFCFCFVWINYWAWQFIQSCPFQTQSFLAELTILIPWHWGTQWTNKGCMDELFECSTIQHPLKSLQHKWRNAKTWHIYPSLHSTLHWIYSIISLKSGTQSTPLPKHQLSF